MVVVLMEEKMNASQRLERDGSDWSEWPRL